MLILLPAEPGLSDLVLLGTLLLASRYFLFMGELLQIGGVCEVVSAL